MQDGTQSWAAACGCVLGLVCLWGCSGGESDVGSSSSDSLSASPSLQSEKSPASSAKSRRLPTTAIPAKTSQKKPLVTAEPPKKGTPQWLIHQMLLLRFEKIPQTDDVVKLRQIRRDRNLKIILLAEESIALTHKDPKLVEVFNAAVHQLLVSRVSIAMQGKEEDVLKLYDLAELFYKRDKKSKAAAEAAYQVATFANRNALRFPDPQAGWLTEFTRQARLFATRFPQEQARSVRLLDAAGRSCEFHGKTADAILCYQQLQLQYPKLVQAQRATAVLRRLQLLGKRLELKGPTIDGGFIDIEDYRSKVVLVVFWASGRKGFEQVQAKLNAVEKKYPKNRFTIIGVNLDMEEPAVDAYLEKTGLQWPQIFYSDRNKRRWNNLLAKHYAIRRIPTLWLVDQQGVVADLDVNPDRLDQQVRRLLTRRTASRP